MTRWWCCGLTVVMACSEQPERVDPFDFPSAVDETDGVEEPNDCDTLTQPFVVSLTGYIEQEVDGFGAYEYRAVPDGRTSIVLRACGNNGPIARVFTFNYFGGDRVTPGRYKVQANAAETGGFEFGYSDGRGEPKNCSDLPDGTITIDSVTFGEITGSFDVRSRCFDELILDLNRRPPYTRYVGSFAARNVGNE